MRYGEIFHDPKANEMSHSTSRDGHNGNVQAQFTMRYGDLTVRLVLLKINLGSYHSLMEAKVSTYKWTSKQIMHLYYTITLLAELLSC